jgi:pimeloyl-ACP methyl ester carboxylesterase
MFATRPILLVGIVLACVVLMRLKHASATDATPPKQPEKGPGGKEYAHKVSRQKSYGEGDTQYWIFEPDQPAPATAPVVVFCHGWSAMDPGSYGPWIEHIVRRGNIVIFPRYQANLLTPPADFTDNAIKSLYDAFSELAKDGHVKPDLERVAAVGHSFGGVVCANLAALAQKKGLPKFKAVMPVEPGAGQFGEGVFQDYKDIPADTLLLCVAGDDDNITHDTDAKRFFKESTTVAKANKNLLVISSDKHGKPGLSANHFVPSALGTGSPLQTYGLWKWFDALTDAAFFGKNRAYALGNTPEQRFMGKWSDGTPVAEPKVVTEP